MDLRFLRGNSRAPKGHAIFIVRSSTDSRTILSTYCIVPPMPLSLTKYLPSFLAAHMPPEEMSDAASVAGMPIPPMFEEGQTLAFLERLAERREDDLCELSPIDPKDEAMRMQMAALASQEYGQLYHDSVADLMHSPGPALSASSNREERHDSGPLEEVDADELLLQSMSDRQRLAELSKLVGIVRYALEGNDKRQIQETQQRMLRITSLLPDKYRSQDLLTAALDPQPRGARLAELYLERSFKLLDEEYADIPKIEKAIRELQES